MHVCTDLLQVQHAREHGREEFGLCRTIMSRGPEEGGGQSEEHTDSVSVERHVASLGSILGTLGKKASWN